MIELIDLIWTLLGAMVAIILLGIIASFSPTLYLSPLATPAKANNKASPTVTKIFGMLLALTLLSTIFQLFQLNPLSQFIASGPYILLTNVIFNLVVGIAFIAAGLWYVRDKKASAKAPSPTMETSLYWSGFKSGFVKTITSLSAAIATFIASGLISNVGPTQGWRVTLTILFLIAATIPFIITTTALNKRYHNIQSATSFLRKHVTSAYFRSALGVVSILFGAAILLLNVLLAISYR